MRSTVSRGKLTLAQPEVKVALSANPDQSKFTTKELSQNTTHQVAEGEEFEFAQAIDRDIAVQCGVRNLSKPDQIEGKISGQF